MKYFRVFLWFFCVAVIIGGAVFFPYVENFSAKKTKTYYREPKQQSFNFQSIDTMKYSRDLSREKLHDISFDAVIDTQMRSIAETGATHVAIGTPYDSEFFPVLLRWVHSARKYGLSIWFRGNWSGWEGWFGYSRLGRSEHIAKTEQFILDNPDLFNDGDLFSSCPECENGGPGDPRMTGDIEGYRTFLAEEYEKTKTAFEKIGKHVQSNLFSMNGDVAKLVMDKKTTTLLDGIVTVDHYVEKPDQLVSDIIKIAELSGGKVVIGEFGVPIPDIHGNMTDVEQAQWIANALDGLRQLQVIYGINYWLSVGGTTELWRSNMSKRPAVSALQLRYRPNIVYGSIRDEFNTLLQGVSVRCGNEESVSDSEGQFSVYFVSSDPVKCVIEASGYMSKDIEVDTGVHILQVQLVKTQKGIVDRVLLWITSVYQ